MYIFEKERRYNDKVNRRDFNRAMIRVRVSHHDMVQYILPFKPSRAHRKAEFITYIDLTLILSKILKYRVV